MKNCYNQIQVPHENVSNLEQARHIASFAFFRSTLLRKYLDIYYWLPFSLLFKEFISPWLSFCHLMEIFDEQHDGIPVHTSGCIPRLTSIKTRYLS